MLIIFIFILALLASLSSEIASHDHGLESSHERIRQQSANHKRDLRVHYGYVHYFESKLLFGYEAYCEDPSPASMSATSGYHFMIKDCEQLQSLLVGQDRYGGYWNAQDWNCISSREHWWITIAGWETCHFAVVVPDCYSYAIAITRFDIANAISMVINDKNLADVDNILAGSLKQMTASMRCANPEERNVYHNVYFTVYDPSNTPIHGNNITAFNGFINGTTTFASFPARPTPT